MKKKMKKLHPNSRTKNTLQKIFKRIFNSRLRGESDIRPCLFYFILKKLAFRLLHVLLRATRGRQSSYCAKRSELFTSHSFEEKTFNFTFSQLTMFKIVLPSFLFNPKKNKRNFSLFLSFCFCIPIYDNSIEFCFPAS